MIGLLFTLTALTFHAHGPVSPSQQAQPLYSAEALDHVLLWTRDVDRATSALAVRMGFQVRPGGAFPDGVANRVIRFSDNSYLELLYFTRSETELSGEALQEYSFTRRSGGGANSFAFAAGDIELTGRHLVQRGFVLGEDEPFSYDPDGDGPRPPAVLWRTVKFAQPPLTSTNIFFIRYDLPARTDQQITDERIWASHPNSALGISAVWLLSSDVAADQRTLERMGFRASGPVHFPQIGARGVRFEATNEAVLLLSPDGPGSARDAVSERGSQIYGISIAVADLDRAQRVIQRGYGRTVERYQGPMGEAIIAPSRDELGLAVELHQSARRAAE